MHFDHGAVQRHRLDLDTHDLSMLQLFKQSIQYTALGPAIHASVDRVPIAEPLGQTAPLATMLGHVQDGIENVQIRLADIAPLPGQTVLDLLVLRFGDFHAEVYQYLNY